MIKNPYWEIVKDHVTPSENDYEGPQVGDIFSRATRTDSGFRAATAFWSRRGELNNMFCWSVPDPGAVDFVVEHSRGKVVDPVAGTGYWTYLLAQAGVACVAFDTNPPEPSSEANHWHRFVSTFMDVVRGDAAEVVKLLNPEYTLFLSWPPYDDPTAHDVLQNYEGGRLIYIGEGNGGCTGDEAFHELLEKEWAEAAYYKIPQWSGIHDYIWVYDRIQPLGQT